MPIDHDKALELFNTGEDRIVVLNGGSKWFIPPFIDMQYDGELNPENRAHKSAIKILEKHDINWTVFKRDYFKKMDHHVSKKKREETYNRDGYICQYCGIKFTLEELCIDHLIPRAKGGKNDNNNLITSCKECNHKKSDLSIFKFIEKFNLNAKDIYNRIIKNNSELAPLLAPLSGAMDKDLDKNMDMDKDKDKAKVPEPAPKKAIVYPSLPEVLTYFTDYARKKFININTDAVRTEAELYYSIRVDSKWIKANKKKVKNWKLDVQQWVLSKRSKLIDYKHALESQTPYCSKPDEPREHEWKPLDIDAEPRICPGCLNASVEAQSAWKNTRKRYKCTECNKEYSKKQYEAMQTKPTDEAELAEWINKKLELEAK